MEMIILAGGKGTRLQSVVSDVPKPMAPINGKPFLEYLLNWALQNGVTRSVLAVSYMKNIITNYFGTNFNGMIIEYSDETQPLGTGGAIRQAMLHTSSDHVIIVNGDTMFRVDLNAMMKAHISAGLGLTVAVRSVFDTARYGLISLDEDRITEIHEKQYVKSGYINGGIYAMKRSFLEACSDKEIFSFEKDVLEKSAPLGFISAYKSNAYFIDIGIPEDYSKAQADFS